MRKQIVPTVRTVFQGIVQLLFFCAYIIVQILIFIGEWTQRIAYSPFFFFVWLYDQILRSTRPFHTIIQTKMGSYVTKVSYSPLPASILNPQASITMTSESIVLPTFRESLLRKLIPIVRTVSHFLKGFLIYTFEELYKFLLYLLKAVRFLSFKVFQILIATPLVTLVILKYTFVSLRNFIFGTWHAIVSTYRFLLSAYFRFFLYGFIACFFVIGIYQAYLFIIDLPSPRSIGKVNFAQSTHLYDRNGRLLYEIYHDVNRTPVKLDELPPYIIKATIAVEDKHFYNHKGISFFGGMLRAFKDTLAYDELQGGSTITQQLVKTALLTPERTVERKLKEVVLALWTEQIYTKDQILEMYLNQVPYGGSAYGIEEAAKVYYGKSAKHLTLPEAAMLVGLPKAPTLFSPFLNKDMALYRRNEVLEQMYLNGDISKLEYQVASKTDLNIAPIGNSIRAPHFVFYTKNYLENEFGSKQVEEGGFNVSTTLDLDVQKESERILKEELEKIKNLNVTNGGIIVLNPQTGEIIAMVGSIDYFYDNYGAFNVTTALRQPGSTLKPMLYALALQRGFTASSPIDDSPIVFQVPGGEAYRPVNYDGQYHGRVTMRMALSNSYNVPAIKVLNMIGVQPFVDFAREMGIDTWQDTSRFGLSIALGGGEVTLLDLAQVYGVFASGGYRIEPTPIRQVVDSKDHIVEQLTDRRVKVIDDGIAYIITDILADNVSRQQAFGPNSALEIPGHTVSVKTGTTNDKKDNLTVGYTPEYLVAVWVGNNDNTPMNPYLTSGITGAAPIWNRVMKYLIENKSVGTQFQKPYDVISKPCYGAGRIEYFIQGTESNANCFDTVIKPNQAKNLEVKRN